MISSNALPKHVQLEEMLIRDIVSGRIADGARLQPERVMAQELGVAVGTLRKALAALEARGLLDRVQGSGNYVRARPVVGNIYSFLRLELSEGGGLPTAKVLDAVRLPKPVDAPAFGEARTAHCIRRLRFLDRTPVAVEQIWLDQRFAEHVRASNLLDSLYYYYRTQLGLIITRIEDRVGVDAVPAWAPEGLDLPAGAPAGFIERLSWDQNNLPAEFSRTWFNPARARYINRLQ